MSLALGVTSALLASIALAIQAVAVRKGTRTNSVTAILTVVFAVNAVLLLPLGILSLASDPHPTTEAVIAFATAGIIGSLLGRACYFVGIERLGASRAEPIKALLPLVAVGTAVLVLGEPIALGPLLGLALLLVGGVLVTSDAQASPITAEGRQFWIDLSYPFLAAILYGLDPVVTKLGFDTGTAVLTGLSIRTATAVLGFAAYLGWRSLAESRLPTLSVDRWLLLAGVANTVYLLAYYAALARTTVGIVAPIISLSTLFVVGVSALALPEEERVTLHLGVGATLVVGGVLLVVVS